LEINMIYNIGDNIVVNVYQTPCVGKIIAKNKIRNSNAYDVKLEDGRLIENCSLNKEVANGFLINKRLTEMFNERYNPKITENENGQS